MVLNEESLSDIGRFLQKIAPPEVTSSSPSEMKREIDAASRVLSIRRTIMASAFQAAEQLAVARLLEADIACLNEQAQSSVYTEAQMSHVEARRRRYLVKMRWAEEDAQQHMMEANLACRALIGSED